MSVAFIIVETEYFYSNYNCFYAVEIDLFISPSLLRAPKTFRERSDASQQHTLRYVNAFWPNLVPRNTFIQTTSFLSDINIDAALFDAYSVVYSMIIPISVVENVFNLLPFGIIRHYPIQYKQVFSRRGKGICSQQVSDIFAMT